MPKRRLPSDSGDGTARKILKVSNQQMEHPANFNETVSGVRKYSFSQSPNELEPQMRLLMPENAVRYGNDEPTNLGDVSSSSRTDTENGAEGSKEESSEDSDMEESLKSPVPETPEEMSAEIKRLKEMMKSKTYMMKH
ncbi:hypothetical protein FGADI_3886 [Fusarium gaditjirri]|uniref:Uncharacterized protein n=1 Tax=Fusarium gaditjirri TaxID=282569 RepID=A0A8H4TEI1_9HYPO|nr:hypothetical protein FGADI_3886 [Fusarium gaditjirri]